MITNDNERRLVEKRVAAEGRFFRYLDRPDRDDAIAFDLRCEMHHTWRALAEAVGSENVNAVMTRYPIAWS